MLSEIKIAPQIIFGRNDILLKIFYYMDPQKNATKQIPSYVPLRQIKDSLKNPPGFSVYYNKP